MNILILGSGGREHVLATAYLKNKRVRKVFVAPGNGLMDYRNKQIVSLPHIASTDFSNILNHVKQNKVVLVDVAQDDPIALGFVDLLNSEGIKTFGPSKKASEIEWNKAWARSFMNKYKLPIPLYKEFNSKQEAYQYVKNLPEQLLFVKASGLAGGKGAIKANNKEDAYQAIDTMSQFGKAGETFLIEECLVGEEFSLFVLCDGISYIILGSAQDHKTVFNADQGLNTGGMGCVSPVSFMTKKVLADIEKKIIKPFMKGMQNEGRAYSGILYLGGMQTKTGVKIIEFNARWGDPEAQVIIPSIQTDYLTIVESALNKRLDKLKIEFDKKVRVSIAASAKGYPGDITKIKGKQIFGMDVILNLNKVSIFGAGIKRQSKKFVVDAGRILHVVGEGKNVIDARKAAYAACSLLFIGGNNLHFRTDIGWREQERLYKHMKKNTVI